MKAYFGVALPLWQMCKYFKNTNLCNGSIGKRRDRSMSYEEY